MVLKWRELFRIKYCSFVVCVSELFFNYFTSKYLLVMIFKSIYTISASFQKSNLPEDAKIIFFF